MTGQSVAQGEQLSFPTPLYAASTGWKQHTIDLTAWKGSTVQLGFLGISAYGNNVFVDDAIVTTP